MYRPWNLNNCKKGSPIGRKPKRHTGHRNNCIVVDDDETKDKKPIEQTIYYIDKPCKPCKDGEKGAEGDPGREGRDGDKGDQGDAG